MERIQETLRNKLEEKLPAALAAREASDGLPQLSLPAPKAYLFNFDEQFTVIGAGQIPCLILLPGRTRVEAGISTGTTADYIHELAVVVLVQDQNADVLHRKRVRYAEAIVETLLKSVHELAPAIHLRITQVAYDRTLRDERQSAYLTSVWVVLECRERVVY